MTPDELKYRLVARRWQEDRWGRYVKMDTAIRFKGKVHELVEVCQRSEFGQWVVVAREYARLVQPQKGHLKVGRRTIKW